MIPRFAPIRRSLLSAATALLLAAGPTACGDIRSADPDADTGGDADPGTPDASPGSDSTQCADTEKDCAGVCFGDAVVDPCGVCDADPQNDCWQGVSGVMSIADSANFNLGSGILFWSISGGQRGYFYAGDNFTDPPVTIASVTGVSACANNFSGYQGLDAVGALIDATALTYTTPQTTIMFGSQAEMCNMGLLVFHQGEQYGVIDFLAIDAQGVLTLQYWLGNPGVTNFANAQ